MIAWAIAQYLDDQAESGAASMRSRDQIDERYRWNRLDIYPSWESWKEGLATLEADIERYEKMAGSLKKGGATALLEALTLDGRIGQLSYRVWYFAALAHDEDQRDNEVGARKQQVQILFAKAQQAAAWFNPELLAIPLETVRGWLDESSELAVYRFYLEEIYRQQEHVLDEQGETLLALAARLEDAPADTYSALTTADIRFPDVTLSDGERVTVSYGRYRAILATKREQADRRTAFEALYGVYQSQLNSYAALYNGVCQRDLFVSKARRYDSTLSAALHGNNIPEQVVTTLIETTREGVAPLQRYHRLRKKTLGLESYHLYDGSIPLLDFERRYPYDEVKDWIVRSVAPLGQGYQKQVQRAFDERWIDVYENEGKRSGAYSAPVYGTHPYMLLNYNDTLDDVFTLAHEMGHSMHTILAHETQPFVYASYTIFVAEVASTLNEALLLDLLLAERKDPTERAVLLQHAIDSICGTFYTQVMFADWELAAHRLAEEGKPLTAESLSALYRERLNAFYGDAVDLDEAYDATWARIPHFYRSPYYVYQYATCFASSARIHKQLGTDGYSVDRYLGLLRAGGNDHPMTLLQNAGADLSKADTVRAVIDHIDQLVDRLERELEKLSG
jgi:oligoendopeptidase F